MNSQYAGWNLICDAHVAPEHVNLLNDKAKMNKVILGLADHLELRIEEPPLIVVKKLEPALLWSDKDEGGLRALMLLEQGHLSVFTFPLRHRVSLDLFTVRAVPDAKFDDYVREQLHVTKRWMHNVHRIWSNGEFNPNQAPPKPTPVTIP